MNYQTRYSFSYYKQIYNGSNTPAYETTPTVMNNYGDTACFGSAFSSLTLDKLVDITVYIKEEYNGSPIKDLKIDNSYIVKWLDVLAELGFIFEYKVFDEKLKMYSIYITRENHNPQSIKLFLNLVRYLYEDNLPNIIKFYYKLRDLIPEADNYELIHLANYMESSKIGIKNSFHGHNCFTRSRDVLVNKECLDSKFLKAVPSSEGSDKLNYTTTLEIDVSFNTNEEIINAYNKLKQPIKELVEV